MGEQTPEHSGCAEFLFDAANAESSPTAGLPGAMAVTEEQAPPVMSTEFPPVDLTCPHGTRFWVYPNDERITALRAMNGEVAHE